MEFDLSRFACPRPECPDFDVRGTSNLRRRGRYGSQKWMQIQCRTCGRTFSERRAYPLFPMRLPHDQVVRILSDLSAKQSIRGVALKEGVDKMTVQNLVRLAETRRQQLRSWLNHEQHVRKDMVRDIIHFLSHRPELKRKNRFA